MSKKIKISGVARELRTAVSAPFRREPARPAGLYLLELRHAANNSLPRRRLMVTTDGLEFEHGRSRPIKSPTFEHQPSLDAAQESSRSK